LPAAVGRAVTPAPLEVVPLNSVRREFEVNVFGCIT
jgi:hypothetical protein